MSEQRLWLAVALVLVGAAIAALVKVVSEDTIGYEVPVSLTATLASGAVGLSGLMLLGRRRLAPLAVLLLLTAPVTFGLFEAAIWDESFADDHSRVVATAAIAALAGALLGTLAAMIGDPAPPLRLLTGAAVVLILTPGGYGIGLVWTEPSGSGEARAAEVLTILALVGYFLAPLLQRALRRQAAEEPAEEPAEG